MKEIIAPFCLISVFAEVRKIICFHFLSSLLLTSGSKFIHYSFHLDSYGYSLAKSLPAFLTLHIISSQIRKVTDNKKNILISTKSDLHGKNPNQIFSKLLFNLFSVHFCIYLESFSIE